jgi:hypothetical protein
MQLHALVHKIAVSVARAFKHFHVTLNQFVALSLDSDVHQNKTSFISASIKHSYVLDVIFYELTWWRQKILIIISNLVWFGIICQSPVVQTITISIFKKRLVIMDSVGKVCKRNRNLFWKS